MPQPEKSCLPQPHAASHRGFLGLTLLVPLTLGILLSWHSLGGLDIWLHHQVGQEILSGDFPDGTNTYSFTEPDHPWTNHEWLFQVLVALTGPRTHIADTGPVWGWVFLRLLSTAALVLLIILGDGNRQRLQGVQTGLKRQIWITPLIILGLFLLWPRLILRPELISYILFVAVVRLLDRPTSEWVQGSPRSLWHPLLPAGGVFWLTVVWAQFHGFSALSPVLVLLAGLTAYLAQTMGRPTSTATAFSGRNWLLTLGLACLALLLTPNGIEGWVYPWRALSQFGQDEVNIQGLISELVPLLETKDSLGLTIWAFKLSLLWGVFWVILTWKHTSPLRVLLWLLAAVLTLTAQRNLGFYALAFMLMHTGTSGVCGPFRGILSRIPRPPSLFIGLGCMISLALGFFWSSTLVGDDFYLKEGVSRRFGPRLNEGRFPMEAAAHLRDKPKPQVFTNVDGAAFLLNQTPASLFIDGRTEAYSPAHWALYGKIREGDQASLRQMEKLGTDVIFLSIGSGSFTNLVSTFRDAAGWDLKRVEPAGFLFVKGPNSRNTGKAPAPGADLTTLDGRLPPIDGELSPTAAADLCLAWSQVMAASGKVDLQGQALKRGLELKPDHPQVQHNLGNWHLAQNDIQTALPLFQGALNKNSRLGGSALNAGVCLLRLQQPQPAIQMFQRAVKIDSDNYQAWANLGAALGSQGEMDRAREAVRRALEIQPNNVRLQSMLRQMGPAR